MDNIESLARDWLEAKRAEGQANRQRLAIEKEIADALEVKSEGSITHTLENYKVTLTQPVSRKLDVDAWKKVAHHCPDSLKPIKVSLTADVAGVKWLIDKSPQVWSKISDAFTTKPGKIGVKVEEL